jgi:hypothetical protein
MMGGSGLLTFAMIAMMVVMMGGMVVGAGWGLVRRRSRREPPAGFAGGKPQHPKTP